MVPEPSTPGPSASALPRTGIVSVEIFDVVLDDSMLKTLQGENLEYDLAKIDNPLLWHEHFRKILEDKIDKYAAARKLQRPMLTLELLEAWRSKSPGGRFLTFDTQKQVWNDVGDKIAREQIAKALKILLRNENSTSNVPGPSREAEPSNADGASDCPQYSLSQKCNDGSLNSGCTSQAAVSDSYLSPPIPRRSSATQTKRTVSSFIHQNHKARRLYSRSADHDRMVQLYQQSISRPSTKSSSSVDSEISEGTTNVLIISGAPGVGKTSLAHSLEPLVQSNNGFFVWAKLSHLRPQQEDPLGPYKSILQDIVRIALDRSKKPELELGLCERIVKAVGEEMTLLTQLVPAMYKLEQIAEATTKQQSSTTGHRSFRLSPAASLEESTPIEQSHSFESYSLYESEDRLKEQAIPVKWNSRTNKLPPKVDGGGTLSVRRFEYAFNKVLKAIASPEHPLVILLDDMQWSKTSKTNHVSEQLVELASSVRTQGGLFIIMTYRLEPDDMAESSKMLNKFIGQSLPNIRQHHLSLSGMHREAIHQMLTDALSLESSRLEMLSQTVSDLTDGNVLFVLEILRTLQDDDLLRYDEDRKQWVCDDHLIRQHPIFQVPSLLDLYKAKISDVPLKHLEVLKTAACLGSNFRRDVLKQVVDDIPTMDTILQFSLEHGFLSSCNSDGHEFYSFCHDSIYQAAYQLIPMKEREARHLKIGQTVWNNTVNDVKQLKSFLFVILEQLFAGESLIQDLQDRVKVAILCLQAGKFLAKSSVFESSAFYLQKGIGLLGPTKWRKNTTYDLCIALFNDAIDTCYATGQVDRVQELVAEVRENARVFEDEIRARIMLIYTLGTKRDLTTAIDLGIETLGRLGEKMSRHPSKFEVWWGLTKTKRILVKYSDEALQRLPVMTEERFLTVQLVLNVMWLSAYYNDPMLAAMISCRMVQLSVKHGVSNVSCVAFAMYSTVVLRGGMNLDEAKRYADLAFYYAEEFGGETWLSRISVALYGLVYIWLKPMPYCLEKLKRAYQIGLGGGDMEFAMVNVSIYLWNNLDRLPVYELEAQARNLTERMTFLGQDNGVIMLRSVRQCYLNFMGQGHGDPTELTGEVLKEEDIADLFKQAGCSNSAYSNATFCKMILAYHYSEYNKATSFCSFLRPMYLYLGTVAGSLGRFYESLAFLATMKRQSVWERFRRLRLIREHISMFRYWSKYSPENHMGKLCFIQAELARYRGQCLRAESKYYCAIVHSRDGGIIMEQALANERAGKYQLELGHTARATEFLQESIRLYKQWGGIGKVDHLRQEVRDLVHL